MIWWLRVRGSAIILGALGAQALLAIVAGSAQVSVPNLRMGSQDPVLLSLFVPLLPAAAIANALFDRRPASESTAVRHVAYLDVGLVVTSVAFAFASLGVADLISSLGAMTLARNFAGLLGIALIAGWGAGAVGAFVAPVLMVMFVIFFNSGHLPGTAFYEWPIHAPSSTTALVVAAALLFVGCGLTAAGVPPRWRHRS
ncbi:MAG: hypothetical protein HYX29_06900 [Solirubrobacterales bacterium]|nr:hypothetical protein [Solirubrobacterales bacterium]